MGMHPAGRNKNKNLVWGKCHGILWTAGKSAGDLYRSIARIRGNPRLRRNAVWVGVGD